MIAFWPFTYPWMLLWAAAAIVPILIHLWSRRRYQELPWAAMAYLLAAVRRNARRVRFEHLLLLVVRTLILLLLAVALADPVSRWLDADQAGREAAGDRHVVLVVDTSYSMAYQDSELTRFELARKLAAEQVRASRRGDGFTLITLADVPRSVIAQPAFAPQDVLTEINQLVRTDGGADLMATLAVVQRIVEEVQQKQRRLKRTRVCFLTDLGRTTWDAVNTPSGGEAIAQLAARAQLQLVDVGRAGAENLAVVALTADQSVVTTTEPTRLVAEIENFAARDWDGVRVEFLVDGQYVAEQVLQVPAGERVTATVRQSFATAGEHEVEVRLSEDRLLPDNRRWLSLPVRTRVRVLCVEGQLDAARYVAWALEPGLTQRPRIQVDVRTENALWEEELGSYDCVFLCNVAQFSRDEADVLRDYVRRGGGIVFFLGDQVDAENYNATLGGDHPRDRLLPVRLGPAVVPGQYVLDPLEYRHPIVEPFRGNERAGLLTTPIWKYVRLQPYPEVVLQVAAAYDTGDPAIVEAGLGPGRVVVVSTAASETSLDRSTDPPTPWSALALWPSFPPLVQQLLVQAMAGRRDIHNVKVGQLVEMLVPATVQSPWVTVTDPAGRTRRVAVDSRQGRSLARVDELFWGGLYAVRWGSDADEVQRFAANLDTRESRLDRLDPARLSALFEASAPDDERSAAVSAASGPKSWFRYVLAVVLGLLLWETLLAWWFGRRAG